MDTQTTNNTDNREAIIAMCLSRIERAMMREITLELLRGSGRNVDKITDDSLDAMAVATARVFVDEVAVLCRRPSELSGWLLLVTPMSRQLAKRLATNAARVLKRQVMEG